MYGVRFVQKSMTLNDLERQIICYGRNVPLILVLLTYLFILSYIRTYKLDISEELEQARYRGLR